MTESDDLGTGGEHAPDFPPVGERVELRVPASLANLPVVRSVAGTLATLLDQDLDAVSDLILAVDEVCSTLIGLAVPGATVDCVFGVGGPRVSFEASVDARPGAVPDTSSFGWQVLTTLTQHVGCEVRPGPGGSHSVCISIVRGRTAGTG
ncbi:hypothetical protein [Actinokineospora sp. NBRC 105648]|uniref:hypothetical protein n=1 Tax=Actinokineospora sp. NBRC 105648 TaxID=3032206 RepID=UPI00249FCB01|nr:hypothetical protein [Actinokineospora sp. NBRC 105648]GLZ39523.1 hypothetical protein Acsp05_31470 [Actinokineospora sp. NBRC 105648]